MPNDPQGEERLPFHKSIVECLQLAINEERLESLYILATIGLCTKVPAEHREEVLEAIKEASIWAKDYVIKLHNTTMEAIATIREKEDLDQLAEGTELESEPITEKASDGDETSESPAVDSAEDSQESEDKVPPATE